MNRVYKTVWNKIRHALMVVNEATSCSQKGGASNAVGASVAAEPSAHLGLRFTLSRTAFAVLATLFATNQQAWAYDLSAKVENAQIGDCELSNVLYTNSDRVFSYNGNLTLIETNSGSKYDEGWFVVRPNKVLDVTGSFTLETNKPDIVFAGYKSDLSVVSVGTEAIFRNLDNFDALGYGLLSAPKISFESVTVRVKPDAGANKNFDGVTRPGESFLVFQNQSSNRENSSYSIENLLNAKTSEGIYVDTTDLEFSDKKSSITTYRDFQVNLGNKDFTLDGSAIDATNGTFYLTKSGTATMEVSGGAKITTSKFDIDNGAQINVATGSSAVFGTAAATADAALTMGGTNFVLGRAIEDDEGNIIVSEGGYGLISVAGNANFNGGEFYFDGTKSSDGSTPSSLLTGVATSNNGNISGSAETIFLRNANLTADGNLELSKTSLTLDSVFKTGRVGDSSGGYIKNIFNSKWTAIKATNGNISITDNSTITMGSGTGLYSVNGSITLDPTTMLTHTTVWDDNQYTNNVASGILHAKNDISVLGTHNNINGLFHAISTDGNIKIFGEKIKIRPDAAVDNMDLLSAKNGSITLAAFENEEADTGNLELAVRATGMSLSNVMAGTGETIRLHGDSGVRLVTATTFFGIKNVSEEGFNASEHEGDTVTITAQKGAIDLQSGASIRTSVYGVGGYGTINIYGQTVTVDAANASDLTEGAFTDVDVNMAGQLYGTAINIGKGVAESQVTVSGTINAIDNTVSDKGYSISLIAGTGSRADVNSELDDGLVLNGATVSYGDADGGSTLLESKGGDIKLIGAKINDNGSAGVDTASDETKDQNQKAGTLTIKLTGNSSDREISFNKSQVNDDIIVIDAAGGTVSLDGSSSVVADGPTETETNNSLTVKGNSVSLAGGSHFGSEVDGTSTGAEVKIQTSDLALDNTSYITSEGAVFIEATQGSDKLTISMDQKETSGQETPSWIKGESVSIGSTNQTGATTVTGGQITSTGATGSSENPNIVIAGGEGENGGVVINDSVVSAGITGSVNIETGVGGKVQIGTEEDNDPVDKDTQILGNNITIGSADGTGNGVDINDAQIGFPKDPEGSSAIGGSISINGGSGAVDIVASEIGVENNDSAHGALTSGFENVTITGDSVSIGSADKGSGAGTEGGFDTAIGGSNITIGDENTDSVKVGDAQIGTATEDDKAGSNVTINAGSDDSLGTITIGSANSDGESVINGGNVTIGAESSNADITINGSRGEAEEDGSSTGITGDKVVIGNGTGKVSVTGSDIASTGTGDAGGITIEAGDDAELVIEDALLDSTGGLVNGANQIGTGTGTGNVTIIGGGSIVGSGITAGGNVNFGDSTTDGNKNDHVVNVTGGSSISGNGMSVAGDTTVNLGGAEGTDKGNSVNIADEGAVTVEGELNIAGGNDIKSEGDLTINTGTTGNGTVNVAEGGSITAGANGEGETGNTGDMTITGNGTVNVAGGKLEANGDGNGDVGNVNVIGADVNLSTGEGGKAGSIVAGGFVTVGGEDSNGQDLGGSINVDAGETGVIIAGGDDGSGNNVVVGNGGQLNVANDGVDENGNTIKEGSLLITNEKDPSSRPSPLPGGLMIDKDTTVAVEDGGHLVSNDITFNEEGDGEDGKLNIGSGGSIYTDADTIINNVQPDGNGNITIAQPEGEGDKGATVQISGTIDKDELDDIRDAVGENTSIVVDHVDGVEEGDILTKDDLANNYNSAVVGDAIIDVSDDSGNYGEGQGGNSISFGGGGAVMVDQGTEDEHGKLTVKNPGEGEAQTGVVITGSETDAGREIVVGAGKDENGNPVAVTDGTFDIDLEDGADLTLGKDGALGGTLSGSITATTSDGNENKPSDVTVNGGNFTVEGGIDLTHPDADGNNTSVDDDGDITIYDHNTTNPDAENGLTVVGDVAAGNLQMSGGDTNLDVGGDLSLSGGASLTGNADVDVAGSITVDDVLDMSGTSSLGKEHAASDAADEGTEGNLTVGGLDITDSASINRNDVAVNGDAHINGTGTSNVGGDFTIGGSLAIGTGVDYNDEATNAGDATVNVNGGNLVTGKDEAGSGNGDLIIGQGNVNVEGMTGSPDEGNITVGANGTGGNLVVGNDGTTPKTPADVSADNNITVENGSATIHDNGHVTAGGAFVVKGDGTAPGEGEPSTGSAVIEGTLSAGTADIGDDLIIGAEVADGAQAPAQNGSVTTSGKTDVAGNLIVNENGQLSVGSNPTGDDDGRLTVGGYVDTEAGSNVVANNGLTVGTADSEHFIGGSLTIGGTSEAGKPNAEFNGDLTVEAGGSFNNTAVVDGTTDTLVSGNLTVGSADAGSAGASASLGDAEVNGTSTINNATVDTGKFTGHGDMTVGAGGALNANGGDIILSTGTGADDQAPKLIVNGGSVTAQQQGTGGGNISVGGYAEVDGALKADGALTVSGANDGGNGLVIGNAANGGDWTAGDALQKDTTVDVGSLTVANDTVINGDGTLSSHGDSAFNGGLHVAAGGDYVNDNADSVTTVKDHLWLDAGSSIDTKGEFVLGATEGGQLLVGNTSDTAGGSTSSGVLNGTITAGSIDFSKYTNEGSNNTITFAGATGEGDDATRFEAGFETSSLTGNVALSDGANAVLTPSVDGKAPVVDGWINVNAGKDGSLGSTLTTNAANKGDYSNADVASGNSTNAVVNMDSSINFNTSEGKSSGLIVGDVGTSTPSESGIYFGANSSLVIDASNMTSGSVLFGNGTADGMDIKVVGDNTTVSIDLSGWTMGTSGSLVFDVAEADEGKFEFTSSNVLQQFGIDDGKIQMTVADIGDATGNTLDSSLQDVVGKVTANTGNTYVGQAFNEVFSSASGLTALDPNNEQDKAVIDDLTASGAVPDGATNIIKTPFGYQYTKDGKTVLALNGNGNKAVEEIATFPVTAGAFNATYEYLTEFNRAVETRALEDRPEGRSQSVWAHVIATFNKSDELFGGSGYSADLYGGVLGTDVVVGGNTLVGGALTVGNGDIESRGAVIDSKNDATFYGVSLYAEHNIGAMSVKGDVTYLKTENDISSTFNGVNMGGSMDTDAISVGIRAEFKAYESDSFEVKPHLGIRYTNYSFDNYRGTDIDDVNAIESPVGVAFSGKVKAEGGWTVVPELDLSVVPQLGDRKATVVNAGAGVDQTILEGAIFNAKLGLGLTKDNFSFGLNYQHGAGGFGRNNNAFQAHARWLF